MRIAKVALLIGLLAVVGCQSEEHETSTDPTALVSGSDGGTHANTCVGNCAEGFESCSNSGEGVARCAGVLEACKVACADQKCPGGRGCCGGADQHACP
jgi:hypothetical protein